MSATSVRRPLGALPFELADPRVTAWIDRSLIAFGIVLLAVPKRQLLSDDAKLRYQALQHFVRTGVPTPIKYQFIGPLFSAPLWAVDRVLHQPDALLLRYNLLLFLAGLGALWWLLRDHADRGLLRLFVIVLLGASMFAQHTMDYLGETFTAVLVGVGAVLVVQRRAGWGWAAVILGAANTPATLPATGLLALRHAWSERRLRHLLVPVAVLAVIVLDTFYRRHVLLVTGYDLTGERGLPTLMPYSGRPGFSYPFLFGLLSILFSFGKGLIFFAPGVLVAWRGRIEAGGRVLWAVQGWWLTFLAGLVLVYAQWWAWYGGWAWGPRFFLFASLPASLALAAAIRFPPAHWLGRLAVAAVALLSAWVSVNGVVYGQDNLGVCLDNNFALEHLCWYVPDFSVLWRPFVVPKATYLPLDAWFLLFFVLVSARLVVPLLAGLGPDLRLAAERVRAHGRGWQI